MHIVDYHSGNKGTGLNYPFSLILWRRQLRTSAVILSSPRPALTKHLHDTMLLTSLPLPGITAQHLRN